MAVNYAHKYILTIISMSNYNLKPSYHTLAFRNTFPSHNPKKEHLPQNYFILFH
ncbi:hypothetical protein Hanom_Chr08g00684881 [Helianthus anomalus]